MHDQFGGRQGERERAPEKKKSSVDFFSLFQVAIIFLAVRVVMIETKTMGVHIPGFDDALIWCIEELKYNLMYYGLLDAGYE